MLGIFYGQEPLHGGYQRNRQAYHHSGSSPVTQGVDQECESARQLAPQRIKDMQAWNLGKPVFQRPLQMAGVRVAARAG